MNINVNFEDLPDGKVKIVCVPPANEVFAKLKGGHAMSPAESMAVMILLKVMGESKRADQNDSAITENSSGLILPFGN